MSEIERCPVCNGRKKILGLGMIEKECTECKGVGHVRKQIVLPSRLHEEDELGDTNFKAGEFENLLIQPGKKTRTSKPRTKKAKS